MRGQLEAGQIELASIHFVGRPKPWEVEPGSYRPGRGAPDATSRGAGTILAAAKPLRVVPLKQLQKGKRVR